MNHWITTIISLIYSVNLIFNKAPLVTFPFSVFSPLQICTQRTLCSPKRRIIPPWRWLHTASPTPGLHVCLHISTDLTFNYSLFPYTTRKQHNEILFFNIMRDWQVQCIMGGADRFQSLLRFSCSTSVWSGVCLWDHRTGVDRKLLWGEESGGREPLWGKGQHHPGEGSLCSLGALIKTSVWWNTGDMNM